ncbi:hypothetical protein HMSSN036_62890 [Paenibacillus macerans]|nr:hypothetical protein HMSSN036_62890 [Paenibacillus macerans]
MLKKPYFLKSPNSDYQWMRNGAIGLVELRQLQYFVKVARKEHVTQAAEELHVAQSAVSRQIHQLEQELGVNLFMQKGRNLHLTAVGQLFCSRVETILKDLDRAVNEVHEFIDPEQGEIRLGFPNSLGIHIIPSVVAEFRKLYPNVKFRFRQGTYPTLIRDVVSGEVDLAFISPFPENHDQVTGNVVLTEDLVAILPPGHPLAGEQSIKLSQLKDEKFILFSKGYSLRPIVWHACLEAGLPRNRFWKGRRPTRSGGWWPPVWASVCCRRWRCFKALRFSPAGCGFRAEGDANDRTYP